MHTYFSSYRMTVLGPDCVKTQSHANFRDALTIPGAKQIDCGAFDEVGLLWAIPVSSFLHSLGRLSPFGILQQDAGLVHKPADLSAICMNTKSYTCVPDFGGPSMALKDTLSFSEYP